MALCSYVPPYTYGQYLWPTVTAYTVVANSYRVQRADHRVEQDVELVLGRVLAHALEPSDEPDQPT